MDSKRLERVFETHRTLRRERRKKLAPDSRSKELLWKWYGQQGEDIVLVLHEESGRQDPYHTHDYFMMEYAYRGNFDLCVRDQTVILKEGDACLLRPEVSHMIVAGKDAGRKIFCCLIHPKLLYHSFLPLISETPIFIDFFLQYLNEGKEQEYMIFHAGAEREKVRNIMEMMMVEYAEKPMAYCRVLECHFATLLVTLAREYREPKKRPEGTFDDSLREILSYIGEHYATATLESTAKQFNYHPNYLTTALRKETGKSFSEHLREFRLAQAAVLLTRTALSISEVAPLVGYSQLSHFYKVFKERFGMTPKEYVREQKLLQAEKREG